MDVEGGASAAVFGLGAVGLSVIQGGVVRVGGGWGGFTASGFTHKKRGTYIGTWTTRQVPKYTHQKTNECPMKINGWRMYFLLD